MTPIKVLVLLLTVLLVAGCSSEEAQDPWEAQFTRARAEASTDFERSALEDGEVSRAEYEEANSRFKDCMDDRGFSTNLIQDSSGLYTYETAGGGEALDTAFVDCSTGTILLVGGLYSDTLLNPNNVLFEELLVDCFARAGLTDGDFTVDDFQDTHQRFSLGQDGQSEPIGTPSDPPFSYDDPRAQTCFANPNTEFAESG